MMQKLIYSLSLLGLLLFLDSSYADELSKRVQYAQTEWQLKIVGDVDAYTPKPNDTLSTEAPFRLAASKKACQDACKAKQKRCKQACFRASPECFNRCNTDHGKCRRSC